MNAALALLCLALQAQASAPAGDSTGEASSAAAAADAPASSEARARYQAALDRMLRGDLAGAAEAFEGLASDPAAGELAAPARALAGAARELARRGRFVLREPPPSTAPRGGLSAPDRSGRAELAVFATVFGIWTGIATAVVTDVSSAQAGLALAIAGGAGGLALALLPTRDGFMPVGRAAAIDAAGTWGSLEGALLAVALDAGARPAVGATLGIGLAALAVTTLATADRAPSAGDVSLVTSGGLWALAAGGLALQLAPDPSSSTVASVLLVAADAGLLAGALAASRLSWSRGHVRMIDAGAILGGLVGLSVPVFADSGSRTLRGVTGLAGLGAGIAVAAALSSGWDDGEPGAQASAERGTFWPAPVGLRLADGRLGVGAGLGGRF